LAALEAVDESALPTIIRFAEDLQRRSPYVAFMYLVDQIIRAAILPHLRRDQLMLVLNQAVDDLIFLRGSYTLEDPLGGQTKNIRTLVLNREHPLVQATLGAQAPDGMASALSVGDEATPEERAASDPELGKILVALESDPENPALLMNAARRYYQLRQYDEAIQYQRRAVSRQPDNVEYTCLLARTLSAAGQIEEAIALCRAVAAKAADHPLPHMTLGSILHARGGAWQEAAAEFRQALDLVADNPAQRAQLLLNIGRCYERLGDEEGARQCCREGLAIVPDHPGLLELDCYLQLDPARREGYQLAKQAAALAVQPGREAETIQAAERALSADQEQYLPYYALGEVHQRLRRPRVAAENLERAAELCPNPATQAAIYQKLSRLYARLGEVEKAQLAQVRAASLGADRIAVQISEEA
ncbi:MAG: tetratricopeptide repeat protein, partial [Anaerolineae bacterium]|nr:tetratricopeptide repeat protein [Anaerolineae bacterium]